MTLAANKQMIPRKDYDDYSKFVNDTQGNRRYVKNSVLLTSVRTIR